MSAAEKLRDLEQHAPGNHWDAEISAALRDALPEVFAVVEAAERVTFYGQEAHRFNEWHGSEIIIALAALDAKLTTKGER